MQTIMAKFTTGGIIKRTPQDVFDFIADPASLARWQVNTEQAEWTTSGQPGVGSTFKIIALNGGKKAEVQMQITDWDPPHRHGFKSIQVPSPVESVQAITTLTPTPEGTQLTLEGEVVVSGIFKLIEGLLIKQVKKQDTSSFEALKQIMETGS
jgi:uncharacterized protein YndB with AHSA1/START domain